MRAACESCLISFYGCDIVYVRVGSEKFSCTHMIFVNDGLFNVAIGIQHNNKILFSINTCLARIDLISIAIQCSAIEKINAARVARHMNNQDSARLNWLTYCLGRGWFPPFCLTLI